MTNEELQRIAEERYKILPGDCRTTRMMKQMAQRDYFEKLRKQEQEKQENNGKLEA
jgi:hypothetical protein